MENLSCYLKNNRYQLFKNCISEYNVNNHYEIIPMIDCTYYQIDKSCHIIPSYSTKTISSSETIFQQMRNDLNDTRCKILTKLTERNITGLELIRAFEEIPKVIEKMYRCNSNIHNDYFIDQLVNIVHDIIIESPYKCTSISKSSPPSSHVSDVSINHEFHPSLISSFSRSESQSIQSLPLKTELNLTPHSSPTKTISSLPTTPLKSLSKVSSEDQSFSMGYQWKGEDN